MCAGQGSEIGKYNDRQLLSVFVAPLIDVTPQVDHSFVTQNFIQSRAPLKSLQSLWKVIWCVTVFPLFCCWNFRAATKKRYDFWWVANLSCKQWKHYALNYCEINYYCHYCHLHNLYKSPLKLSDWNPHHHIQRLQQETHWTGVKLVSGWMFGGYSLGSSCKFTEVRPVSAAGGRLASLPQPHAEPLETDLGTIIKLLSINILIPIIAFFSISSMSCDPVTPSQQQIVLVTNVS